MPFLTEHAAMVTVARLASVGVLISCAEYIAAPRHLKADGLMSWEVGRLRQSWLVATVAGRLLDRLVRYPNVLGLLVARAALAIVIVIGPATVVLHAWLICLATLLAGVFILRSAYGQDGADQMAWIIFASLALATIAGTARAMAACLWFLALQACLSYFTAGAAKASAGRWRDGSYLVSICGTRIYGNLTAAHILAARPWLARLVARVLIGWECAFPLVLVVPQPAALAILATGILFHLNNAVFMGLNTFFWSFLATYPAILYCIQTRGW